MSKKLIYLFSLVLVLGMVLTSVAKADLVGWWKFDEGSGTIAADSSGQDMHGVLGNDPVWREDGVYKGCLFFDGDQAHVRITHQDSLNPAAGSFTVTFWAYVEVAPGTRGATNWDLAVNKRDSGSVGYYVGADRNQGSADQTGYRFMLGDAAANRTDTPYLLVPLGEWVFVAAVLDRDQNAQKISVDGGQTWATTTPPPGPIAPAQDLGIGWDIGINDYWFHGRIDDVRLYDWPLSAKEILIVMEGGEGFPLALRPVPKDGAMLEATWANLSWMPGSFAISHDLYFGASFDDVNDGAEGTFVGNLATASQIVGFFGFPAPDGLVPGTTYYWRIDEVNDTDPNSPWKGDVWSFMVPPRTAYEPKPADDAKFIDPDVELSWTAGFGAKLHTIYFGDNFDDVNNAAEGPSQTDTTYTPGTLELDKTYYWRVDEFDAAATYKGDVWSFKTLPDVPITDPNLVGWWTLDEGMGTTAVDWSGHENHGTLVDGPQWVEGYFDGALEFNGLSYVTMDPVADDLKGNNITLSGWVRTTDTHGLWFSCNTAGRGNVALWSIDNSRATMYDGTDSSYEGYSNKVVSDGEWHMLTYVRSGSTGYIYVDGFLENTHAPGYSFSATDLWSIAQEWDAGGPSDFLVGTVDDVRIYDTALTQDEIKQLMRGDITRAWNPSPANWSTPYIRDAMPLSWSPGDNASEHDVYFGTDRDTVADADASDTTGIYRGRQGVTLYTPSEGVEWGGGPYYWRIDEYNSDATVTTGGIWSFTVADFIGIDNIEDYNDYPPDEIFSTWIDGWEVPTNGSLAGHADPPFAETGNVHGGRQSMPVYYENNFKYSEITMTLVSVRDWTEEGVGVLSLWFYGDAANAAERMYVNLNGIATVYHDNPDAALIEEWTEWTIDLQEFAAQGVNLTNVNTISIGFGDKNNLQAGGSGMVLCDDIRLYRPAPEPEPAP